MAKKNPLQPNITPNLFSLNAGNGACRGLSTQRPGVIMFEPLIAPLSDKKDLEGHENKPAFSLRTDGQIEVFGLNDVNLHGKANAKHRLNSAERYTDPDYFKLIDVLLLQLFAGERGNSAALCPTGIISVPISEYQKQQTVDEIRRTLATGKDRVLVDYDGCELRLCLSPENLIIVPESVGSLYHYVFDPETLASRPDISPAGLTIVVDGGFMSTDVSLFDGLKYLKDSGHTIMSGMSNVIYAVRDYVKGSVRGAEITYIDSQVRGLAGLPIGAAKGINFPNGRLDVQPAYDAALIDLARLLSDEILSVYKNDSVSRVLLAGGGAFHLEGLLGDSLSVMGGVDTVPDADESNVIGQLTMLQKKLRR